jgi:hypothetical protein
MASFDVTVTQRDLAPVDAAAASKCKCKCDGAGGAPAPAAHRPAGAGEERSANGARQSVELSPLADDSDL